jgi:hypothetical protein
MIALVMAIVVIIISGTALRGTAQHSTAQKGGRQLPLVGVGSARLCREWNNETRTKTDSDL